MTESAAVAAWELGLRLKERREHLDLVVAAVAKAMRMQQPNLSSVESGRKKITEANLIKLGKYYEFDEDEMELLQQLRIAADRREWYHQYSWLFTEDFVRYLGLEAGAAKVAVFQGALVHGLLQTEEYAQAVIRGASPYIRLTELEPRIDVRLARQKRLTADKPLEVTAVLGEAVLRQQVGGPEVMRRQAGHIAAMMELPNIDIRVLPFSVGAHPALGGPFDLLSFHSPKLSTVCWQETLTPGVIYDRPQYIREYTVALLETQNLALSAEDSLDFVREVAKGMK
jgi:transcriptional regulator with XRE-family HTH domain